MRRFHYSKQKTYCPTINLDGISSYIEKASLNETDTIDITRWGFFKLLGKGKIPTKPLIIKAKIFSKKAQMKIIKSGGMCILLP
jgi:large subunit ribosomal protein L27Ae